MKRIIAAAALVVFIIGIYVTGYLYIDFTCKETEKLVEECIAAYERKEDIKSHTADLEKYWSSKEKLLSVFTNHAAIDEIELAIESLAVHSKYPDNEMFYEYSSTLKMYIHQMMEDTKPGVHSIM